MTYKYFILARHFIIIILMFLSGSIMATMDTVSVTTDTGAAGSLRQIVTHATTGDTIVFSSMIDGDSIQLTSGQITIDKDLVIIGNGTTNTIIDGSMDNNSRLFKLTNAAEVKMSHLTIQNGGGPEASLLGGAILIESSADLILYNCVLQHNKSNGQDSGGAIAVLNGTCTSINCIFDGNQSLNNSGFSRGGAVLVAGSGQYDAVNCLFVNNTSANNGAVLTNNSGIVTITNCTLTDNTSTSNSVLYHQSGATTTLNNNIIHTNNGSLPISGTSTLIASNNLIDSAGLISNGTNGNFIGAPMFIDTLSGNYRLKSTSPANNAGINDSIPTGTLTDLDGNPRIRQDTVDIGAYEGISCTVPDTLYVNIDNTSPTAPADGSSWSSALTDLQEAINISNACGGGKQIWVAEGTYRPTQAFDLDEQNGAEQRERTFYITQPVQIYGGFTPGATMLSQRDFMNRNTILTADLGNNQDTAYHIMFMTADSITSDWVIDGLKIQDGRAQGTSDNNMNGGGIYAVGVNTTSPSLTNCTFTNNSASGHSGGGAFYVNTNAADATTSPNFINCSFSNNSTTGFFGGGAVLTLAQGDNSITSPDFINCTFLNNTSNGGDGGGACFAFSFDQDAMGTTSPNFVNCTFTNNKANNGKGGAVYVRTESNMGKNSSAPTFTNCILWDNEATQGADIYVDLSGGTVSHCILSKGMSIVGAISYMDTLVRNPLFHNAINGDLLLQSTSPAINAGDNSFIPTDITTDLDGNARIRYGTVDMGAYEGIPCSLGDTIYVNHANTAVVKDGSSWASALTDLQEALDISNSCDGDYQIWVAKGTYSPTMALGRGFGFNTQVQEQTFYITQPVSIYGGFQSGDVDIASRNWATNETILSGALDNGIDTAFHVVVMESDSITEAWSIDGVTISDGRAVGDFGNDNGGGVYISNVSNSLTFLTSGFFEEDKDVVISPSFTNCIFTNNNAAGDGGSVYAYANNNIHGGLGGTSESKVIASPSFTNCIFIKNKAAGNGGGIYVATEVDLIQGLGTLQTISPYFSSCSFNDNIATLAGGAVYASSGDESNLILISGTISNRPIFSNCISWGNNAPEGSDLWLNSSSVDTKISYSIFSPEGVFISSLFNNEIDTTMAFLHDDPMFMNASIGDLRLMHSSPAINAGINDSIPVGIITDLDGNPRIRYGTVDIGAYEGIPCSLGDTIYVNHANTGVVKDGSSWASALTELQEAINISNACDGGKQIWIADGTYSPTVAFDTDEDGTLEEREKTFLITQPVQIYGGFQGMETDISDRFSSNTIFTGVLENSKDTAYHVVVMKGDSITSSWSMDGVTIRDGRASGNLLNSGGGGVLAGGADISTSPQFSNCNFINNNAVIGGGVIAFNNGTKPTTSPIFTNCSFIDNTALGDGGGLYASGSGIASPIIANCTFLNNTAGNDGGGVYVFGNDETSPIFTNCTISKNIANHDGGGIYLSPTVSSPQLLNCILWDNQATNEGSDLWLIRSISGTKISNSIFSSGGLFLDFRINHVIDTSTVFLHEDPQFVDANNGDLRLQRTSPAIDNGSNADVISTIDLSGRSRSIFNGKVEMGAFENFNCPDVAINFSPPDNFSDNDIQRVSTDNIITADNMISDQAEITFNAMDGAFLGKNFEVSAGAVLVVINSGCATEGIRSDDAGLKK